MAGRLMVQTYKGYLKAFFLERSPGILVALFYSASVWISGLAATPVEEHIRTKATVQGVFLIRFTASVGIISSSCGLFVLKLMEEWTGHELAHDVTQNGIKLFKKQLPLLLHDSVLNDLKGTPEYEKPDNNEDANDVIMWDKNCPPPTEVSQRSETLVTDSTKDPKLRLPFDGKRQIMAAMCDCWPGMEFHVSDCNSILLPYRTSGEDYILFVFNLDQRTVTLLDPIPSPDMCKTRLHHKYVFKLKEISFYLNIALQDAIEGWKDDIFLWRRITPCGLPTNNDSHMSGFLVLKFMRWWDGQEVIRANGTVGIELKSTVVTI
ncbi:hypothetical protein ACQ4PT_033469 [Festuca glaucescens]